MSDLDEKEQKHVRTALLYLRRRSGSWAATAEALHCSPRTLEPVMSGRMPVSASIAFRVARLVEVPVDDLLSGRSLPGACPKCGHVPDFADESTTVEEVPPPTLHGGLNLVK